VGNLRQAREDGGRPAACAVRHAVHYDVFGGRKREGQIYPLVRSMIIAGD
jgi:hypothetical protein